MTEQKNPLILPLSGNFCCCAWGDTKLEVWGGMMTTKCRGRGRVGCYGNYINEVLILYQAAITSSGRDPYRLNSPDGGTTSWQSWLLCQCPSRETLEDSRKQNI